MCHPGGFRPIYQSLFKHYGWKLTYKNECTHSNHMRYIISPIHERFLPHIYRWYCHDLISTHLPLDKVADVMQTTFPNAFLWMNLAYYDPKFTDVCSWGSNWHYTIIDLGNGLAPYIFKCIFMNGTLRIMIQISKFVPKGPIDNNSVSQHWFR